MEPKQLVKFSISRVEYNEYQTMDSRLLIECDILTASKIIEFISKLKIEAAK